MAGEVDMASEVLRECELFLIAEAHAGEHQHAVILERLHAPLDHSVIEELGLVDMDAGADVRLDGFDSDAHGRLAMARCGGVTPRKFTSNICRQYSTRQCRTEMTQGLQNADPARYIALNLPPRMQLITR
jgi:hypothetical protein